MQGWFCRVGVDIKDEYLVRIQAAGPKIIAVVGKAGMMGLVTTSNRQ